jgi:hypothetical protein
MIRKFDSYICANAKRIPNYGERHRAVAWRVEIVRDIERRQHEVRRRRGSAAAGDGAHQRDTPAAGTPGVCPGPPIAFAGARAWPWVTGYRVIAPGSSALG